MKTKTWIWGFGDYDELLSLFDRVLGWQQGVLVRCSSIEALDGVSNYKFLVQAEIDGQYIYFQTVDRSGMDYLIHLDEWEMDVVVIPASIGLSDVGNFIKKYTWLDSRGASFEGLSPEARFVVDAWGYAVWVQCALVDSRRTCLIRASGDVADAIDRFMESNSNFLERNP